MREGVVRERFELEGGDPLEPGQCRQRVRVVGRSLAVGQDGPVFLKGKGRPGHGRRRLGPQDLPFGGAPQRLFPGLLGSFELGQWSLELLLEKRDAAFEAIRFGLLLRGGGGNRRRFIGLIVVLGLVVEGEEPIVLIVPEGVIRMAVALDAAEGRPHPDLPRRVDAVKHGRDPELLVVGSPLGIGHGVSMEGRRDELVEGSVGQEIARDLLDGELIEGHVLVECIDEPVPVAPDGAPVVLLVALRVGVAGKVEPEASPALAVVGGGQEPIYQGFIGLGGGVPDEGRRFLEARRQTGQIQAEAPGERVAVRFGAGLEALLFQARQDEEIHPVSWPPRVLDRRRRLILGLHEGPVVIVGRALSDPALEVVDLLGAERVSLGRHAIIKVARGDSPDELAFLGLPRDDGALLGRGRLERFFPVKEAQAAFLLHAPVALEADRRENRANVAVEVDRRGLSGESSSGEDQGRRAG